MHLEGAEDDGDESVRNFRRDENFGIGENVAADSSSPSFRLRLFLDSTYIFL